MAYSCSYSKLCLSDLDETLEYIKTTLNNPKAANDLLIALQESIEQIKIFPYAFQDCSIYLCLDQNIRHILIKNFVLIYLVDKKSEDITLLRFQYAGRNIADINLISD